MPTLTEDMKEAIWKSFQETKSYKEMAERLHRDPRTVADVVKKRKAMLAAKLQADSQAGKPAMTTTQNVDPVLEVQLRAYMLFENGRSNLQVAQELKLGAGTVMKYRKEFNDMKKDDLDQELEQKKRNKMRFDELIQESQDELAQNQSEVKRIWSEIKMLEDRLHYTRYDLNYWNRRKEDHRRDAQDLKKSVKNYEQRTSEAKQRCLLLEKKVTRRGGLHALFKQADAIPVYALHGQIDAFYNSNIFKIVCEPMAQAALCAIALHPNRIKLLELLFAESGYNSEVEGHLIDLGLGTEEYKKFVIDMAYAAPFTAIAFMRSSKSGTYVPIKIPDLVN